MRIFIFSALVLSSTIAYAQEQAGTISVHMPRGAETSPSRLSYNTTLQTQGGSVTTVPSPLNQNGVNTNFMLLIPQVGVEIKNAFISSAAVGIPMYWDQSSDGSSSRSLGRPEIGLARTLVEGDDFSAELALDVRLPIYEDSSGFYPEGNRVFQIAPLISTDTKIVNKLHFVNSAKVCYDTKASVALPVGNDMGTSLDRSVALRLTAGLERSFYPFTVGVGIRTTNGIGQGHVMGTDGLLSDVAPLDLMSAEISGTWDLRAKSKVNFSLTKGLKTKSDAYNLAQQDIPEEIADVAMSVSLAQTF